VAYNSFADIMGLSSFV